MPRAGITTTEGGVLRIGRQRRESKIVPTNMKFPEHQLDNAILNAWRPIDGFPTRLNSTAMM
mgnify:CR=1 FL=1